MTDRVRALFGIETEYAVSVGDGTVPLDRAIRQIYERATARPHVPGIESGIFLSNGGRFYIDGGYHPEYASPETIDPWDAVRYAIAGDRLMSRLAHEVANSLPEMSGLLVRKGNVDYVNHTTWASHENYLHRRSPTIIRPGLITHLISRIVFTGGGGFDPFTANTPPFVLSPRAFFVRRLIASSASGSPALVDDRNQPHCQGFHRQHVMCSDATQSELSTFLRIGTTALVVALLDAGCAADSEVELAEPIAALRTVTRDLALRERLPLASGSTMTAIEIQRHYVRQARAHLDRLPQWAATVCDVWEDTLQRLERGPAAVADRLDWAIKRAMLARHAARHGVRNARLQQELWEIDLRFGQVYPASLFQSLDEAGVLRHHVAGIAKIDEAMSCPPSDGRAHIRGAVVARMAGETGVQCGWDMIRDSRSRLTLDLSSPFATVEEWREPPPTSSQRAFLVGQLTDLVARPPSAVTTRLIREATQWIVANAGTPGPNADAHAIELNNLAISMRTTGRLSESEGLFRAALAVDLAAGGTSARKIPHRRNNLASVLLMQGRLSDACEQVTLAWRQIETAYDRTSVRVLVLRLAIALLGGEPSQVLIGQVKRHIAMEPLPDFANVEPRWRVAPLLEALGPRLTMEQHMLLKGIADVLNGDRLVESLLGVRLWRETPEQPLDVPWPVVSAAVVERTL